MRKIFVIIGFFLFSLSSFGQMRWNHAYQEYINQYKDLAIEQMKKYHIPASITLAQGLFESAAGRSKMAIGANNHFGIKCHRSWTGRTTYHDDDLKNECFRAYDNVYESYEDHSRFLAQSSRYRSLFNLNVTDYKGWAYGLKSAGYATNPQYANKLIDIIQLYKLHNYDQAKKYDKFFSDRSKDKVVNGILHPITMFNDNYYIVARSGDTFKSIGEEVGISYKKIAKYNERDKKDAITKGEIIFLKKKKTKAPKSYKGRLHYVKNGESMYSISQLYGIRIKSLYKMNNMSPNDQIHIGDALRLR